MPDQMNQVVQIDVTNMVNDERYLVEVNVESPASAIFDKLKDHFVGQFCLIFGGNLLNPQNIIKNYRITTNSYVFAFQGEKELLVNSRNTQMLASQSFQELLNENNERISKLNVTSAALSESVFDENSETTHYLMNKLLAQDSFYQNTLIMNAKEITKRGISFNGLPPNPVQIRGVPMIAGIGAYPIDAIPIPSQ